MTSPVEHTSQGPVVTLRMQHGKVQALDVALVSALDHALAEVAGAGAGALLLIGQGRAFSAGVDLKQLLAGGDDYVDQFLPALSRMLVRLFAHPGPVIAAINGHAIAGGCVIACACDYKVMSQDATIGVPELRVGVPFPVAPLEILRFALADPHLQEFVYVGKTYSADEALHRGMVDEVVPAEQVATRAVVVAERFAMGPAARFRLTKEQLRRPTLERIRQDEPLMEAKLLAAWKDKVTRNAIQQYMDELRR
jgi:enoyl-CoA hydratase